MCGIIWKTYRKCGHRLPSDDVELCQDGITSKAVCRGANGKPPGEPIEQDMYSLCLTCASTQVELEDSLSSGHAKSTALTAQSSDCSLMTATTSQPSNRLATHPARQPEQRPVFATQQSVAEEHASPSTQSSDTWKLTNDRATTVTPARQPKRHTQRDIVDKAEQRYSSVTSVQSSEDQSSIAEVGRFSRTRRGNGKVRCSNAPSSIPRPGNDGSNNSQTHRRGHRIFRSTSSRQSEPIVSHGRRRSRVQQMPINPAPDLPAMQANEDVGTTYAQLKRACQDLRDKVGLSEHAPTKKTSLLSRLFVRSKEEVEDQAKGSDQRQTHPPRYHPDLSTVAEQTGSSHMSISPPVGHGLNNSAHDQSTHPQQSMRSREKYSARCGDRSSSYIHPEDRPSLFPSSYAGLHRRRLDSQRAETDSQFGARRVDEELVRAQALDREISKLRREVQIKEDQAFAVHTSLAVQHSQQLAPHEQLEEDNLLRRAVHASLRHRRDLLQKTVAESSWDAPRTEQVVYDGCKHTEMKDAVSSTRRGSKPPETVQQQEMCNSCIGNAAEADNASRQSSQTGAPLSMHQPGNPSVANREPTTACPQSLDEQPVIVINKAGKTSTSSPQRGQSRRQQQAYQPSESVSIMAHERGPRRPSLSFTSGRRHEPTKPYEPSLAASEGLAAELATRTRDREEANRQRLFAREQAKYATYKRRHPEYVSGKGDSESEDEESSADAAATVRGIHVRRKS